MLLQVFYGVSVAAYACGDDARHTVFQFLCFGFMSGQGFQATVVLHYLPEAVVYVLQSCIGTIAFTRLEGMENIF